MSAPAKSATSPAPSNAKKAPRSPAKLQPPSKVSPASSATSATKGSKKKNKKSHTASKKKPAPKVPLTPVNGPVPVTLLSGFLGAGKTTLLEHILKNKEGIRCAVVVNDMAEINIDSSLLKGTRLLQTKEQVVELQNGCICCTLREDLLLALREMALSNRFDVIVIESTGISEPMQVAETFYIDPEDGSGPLYNLARLDTCVTVVDASTFYDNLQSYESVGEKRQREETADGQHKPDAKDPSPSEGAEEEEDEEGEEGQGSDSNNISHLLIDQVEFANVIILNKTDLVPAERVEATVGLLRSLNPTAHIICTRRSQVDVREMLFTNRFSEAFAQKAVGWMADVTGPIKHVPETLEYGIGSFVYRSDKPFHPDRLFKFLMKYFLLQEMSGDDVPADGEDDDDNASGSDEEEGEEDEEECEEIENDEKHREELHKIFDGISTARRTDLGNLFRSKGYVWIGTPSRHSSFGEWNHAGNMLRFNYSGEWAMFPGLGGAEGAAKDGATSADSAEISDVPAAATADDKAETSLAEKASIHAIKAKENANKGNSLTSFFHEKEPCQEIVMIGQDLKRDVITQLLDECLLTSDERLALAKALEEGGGLKATSPFKDPFEAWPVAPMGEDVEMINEPCPINFVSRCW